MKYIVTEEIESPSTVAKNIEVFDLIFVTIYVGASLAMMSLVHSNLRALFMIFSLLVSLFLTAKSPFNVKRRNYESIFLLMKKDIEVYKSVYQTEEYYGGKQEKEERQRY